MTSLSTLLAISNIVSNKLFRKIFMTMLPEPIHCNMLPLEGQDFRTQVEKKSDCISRP